MKVRLKQRAKRYETLSCRCCDRVMFKEAELDKQTLKESLEEIDDLQCDRGAVLSGYSL